MRYRVIVRAEIESGKREGANANQSFYVLLISGKICATFIGKEEEKQNEREDLVFVELRRCVGVGVGVGSGGGVGSGVGIGVGGGSGVMLLIFNEQNQESLTLWAKGALKSCLKASNGQRFPCPTLPLLLNEIFLVFLGKARQWPQ